MYWDTCKETRSLLPTEKLCFLLPAVCAWVQTGYYDRPIFIIRKHFSLAVYFDSDLFRPPQHFPQTALYANVWFSLICLLSIPSDETWMPESFSVMKVPPPTLTIRCWPFTSHCFAMSVWPDTSGKNKAVISQKNMNLNCWHFQIKMSAAKKEY